MLANFSNLITFSRGSNATVTDASGRLTYAANNLLTNSETFEASAWIKGDVTVVANSIAAPNGTTTADSVVEAATTAIHRTFQAFTTSSGVPFIASVYARANGSRRLYINAVTIGNVGALFDLTGSGSVVNLAGTATNRAATIEAVGNGFYRCTIVGTGTGTANNIYFQINRSTSTAATDETYLGDGTSGLYLWGAQLEAVTYQTTPSPYVSTSVANLLGFSEAFDNAAWTKSNASIVTGAAQNPINQLWNAQKLMENTAASSHYALQAVSALAITYTLSIYAKAGERSFASLGFDGLNAWFNLSAGTLGAVEAGLTASITSVGNGWYRCSVTRTVTSAGSKSCVIYSATANNVVSYTGDGNSGIYIYGAQLSNSGSLDPYVPTPGAAPSSTAYYGPRFDYDPVTLAPKGLLVEEARTNVVLTSTFATLAGSAGSQYPSGAGWSNFFNTGGTRTYVASSIFAGGQAVDISGASAARNVIGFSFAAASSTTYTVSFYVEAASGVTGIVAYATGALGTGGTTNNVTAPTATGRYSYTFTTGTAAGTVDLRFGIGCATSESGSIRISNVQCEAGAFATSYIPTVASTVTRSADVATITGSLFSGWYNQSEGSWVAAFLPYAVTGTVVAQISASTNNDRFQLLNDSTQQIAISAGGVGQGVIDAGTVSASTANKLSYAYRTNDTAASLNGGAAVADTTVTLPVVDRLCVGATVAPAAFLNGHIRSVQYIPNATSASQLQAATS